MDDHLLFVVSPTSICSTEAYTNTATLNRAIFSSAPLTTSPTYIQRKNLLFYPVSPSICSAEAYTNTTTLNRAIFSPAPQTFIQRRNQLFYPVSRSICPAEAHSDTPTFTEVISSPATSLCPTTHRSTQHSTASIFPPVSCSICLAVALADTACLRIPLLPVNINNTDDTTTPTIWINTTKLLLSGKVICTCICLAEALSDTPHSVVLQLAESISYGPSKKMTQPTQHSCLRVGVRAVHPTITTNKSTVSISLWILLVIK